MPVIIKIDRGVAERLLEIGKVRADGFKNIKGEELTLEVDESEIFIERQREGRKGLVEVSDVNGTFGIWFVPEGKLKEKLQKALSKE
ncbi:MAG TPA: hypothetical protein VJH90_00370 [archaeon]|nr:hypothetical protein [archaeon]